MPQAINVHWKLMVTSTFCVLNKFTIYILLLRPSVLPSIKQIVEQEVPHQGAESVCGIFSCFGIISHTTKPKLIIHVSKIKNVIYWCIHFFSPPGFQMEPLWSRVSKHSNIRAQKRSVFCLTDWGIFLQGWQYGSLQQQLSAGHNKVHFDNTTGGRESFNLGPCSPW